VDETLEHWFLREIVAHEAALMRYISRAWPDRNEAHDIRQEIYTKVFEAAAAVRPTLPRQFLFTIARNLILDKLRHGKIVSIELHGDLESLNVLIDTVSPERMFGARQELRRLTRAFQLLPPLCREIVWRRKVEELPQKEVASLLGINERAVERGVARGIRLLSEYFYGNRVLTESPGDRQPIADEDEHGMHS